MPYLYNRHIRLVQTDKTAVAENSINQDSIIKKKILSAKTRNAHTNLCRLLFLLTRPANMEQADCSDTSAHKIQTKGYDPKERIQHSKHGASLKSRTLNHFHNIVIMFLCFSEKKRKATKYPEYLPQIKKN